MEFVYLIEEKLIDSISLIVESYGFTLYAKPGNKGKRIVMISCPENSKNIMNLFKANREITNYLNTI